MDLVASSSRSRYRQPSASLPPLSAVPAPQSPLAPTLWEHGSGAGSVSHGSIQAAATGSWRDSVGGGDLMDVLARSTGLSAQPQFQQPSTATHPAYGPDQSTWRDFAGVNLSSAAPPEIPPTPADSWRDSLGRDDLMSVVAQGVQLSEPPQAYPSSARPYGNQGLDGSTWPPFADTGSRSSAAQPAMRPTSSGSWRESLGGDDLMSVVAQGVRLSEPAQAYPASVLPHADHGLEGSTWPPFADTGSRSSAAQPAMPPDASGPWRANFGEDDLMSIVAGSARHSQPPQHLSPAASLLVGDGSGSSAPQFTNMQDVPAAVPATEQPSSGSRQRPIWLSRFSQQEFDAVTNAVISGDSVEKAIQSIGRKDVPTSTVQYWLGSIGVSTTYRRGRRHLLSVAQIESAQRAHADHIRATGSQKGSVEAAYRSLDPGTISNSAFRAYFHPDGLTHHGNKMLELARRAESRAARGSRSGTE
ncbi:MAG TPA: hypothetical protein VFL86_08750 [Burkholderiaceae bacterium]|nr:hypothetical protein [Burkholderiaceae bacterium]